ncbi:minor tail protein [Mycobacterium phage Chargerpower]|nr:minor tail protein [Mycobacterium phage Chargerpower]
MTTWPTTPSGAIGADGAFEIGGGEFDFGQQYTENIVKSLFTIPSAASGDPLAILRDQMLKLPLDVLKSLKDYIPGASDGDFLNVSSAVTKILESLILKPSFLSEDDFQAFIDAITGLTGGDASDVLAVLDSIRDDATQAIRDALTGIVNATPTDLDDWLLKLLTPQSEIVQNFPIPNVGGLPDVLHGLSTGVADIKSAISNLWNAVPTPVTPQDPNTTIFDTAGTFNFTVPAWMLTGDKIELIALGGGCNAPLGFSGKAGLWSAATVTVGSGGVVAGATLTVTVGAGGAQSNSVNPGGASTVRIGGTTLVSAAGGPDRNVGIGEDPGNQDYDGITYYGGGSQVVTGADGKAPGGGGCGGPFGFFGGRGAPGRVWVRVVQTLTSGTLIDLATRVSGTLPVANGGTGATTAAAARSNIGAQAQSAALDTWAAKTPPSGALVGTTDTQALSGKTMSGANNTFSNISADSTVDGTTNKVYTAVEKVKLSTVASGATVNDTDANLKNRANHTGTQAASTISDFNTAADARVAAATIAMSQLGTGKVAGSNNGTATSLTIWVGTEAQYTAIGTKDPNTLYFRTA